MLAALAPWQLIGALAIVLVLGLSVVFLLTANWWGASPTNQAKKHRRQHRR